LPGPRPSPRHGAASAEIINTTARMPPNEVNHVDAARRLRDVIDTRARPSWPLRRAALHLLVGNAAGATPSRSGRPVRRPG
jgi:hypothetical protein